MTICHSVKAYTCKESEHYKRTQSAETNKQFNQMMFLVQVQLRQKYHAPQVRPDWGSNSRPQHHDSTFYVTKTPALAGGLR